jgi:hypothetical protein
VCAEGPPFFETRTGASRQTKARWPVDVSRRARESDKDCLRREIKEELPKLKLGRRGWRVAGVRDFSLWTFWQSRRGVPLT